MKRLLFNTFFALLVSSATAQTLSVASVEAKAGELAELVVNASGMSGVTALQFNLALPQGITLNESAITKGGAASGHTLNVQTMNNGDRLIVLYHTDLEQVGNGTLLRLPITMGQQTGNFSGSLYTVRTATTEAESKTCDNATFTMTVKEVEQPVTITANDITITYGDVIPTLTYKTEGAELNGTPKLTTTATKDSPIGVYPIKVEQGTVTNTAVTYVDGTLTIQQNTNDITSHVGISQQDWNAGGMVGWAAPLVITRDGRETALAEKYAETAKVTGTVLEQTVVGLNNGTYEVTLFANAFYTDGRGFTSNITNGQMDVVYVFANDTKQFIPSNIGGNVVNLGVYSLKCYVTDGTLKMGMTAEREGTNWHSIQIKSLDYISDEIPSNIENMPMNGMGTNNAVYDLQGRRVTNPTKGIYIVDGKMMVK